MFPIIRRTGKKSAIDGVRKRSDADRISGKVMLRKNGVKDDRRRGLDGSTVALGLF